jgi:Ala-tRNA(Pro) deacylase
MPTPRLKQYLDENSVCYLTIEHSPAYTSQGIAALLHIPGWQLAKSVIVKADERYAVVVLPAPAHVDLVRVQQTLGARHVTLATEAELQALFPGCELGAMPPFGNLYGLPVYVDERLAEDPSIVFNAGSHREAVRMAYTDFERLVHPKRADLRYH